MIFTITYSVNKKDNHHHGVGLIIKQNFQPKFIKISNRICKATLKIDKLTVTILAVYAPTHSNSEKKTKERELFYEQLASEIHKTPNKNFLIILGDFNAKTGSGHNEFPEQIGKYGKGKMNSTGRTLLETCLQYELIITNTLFNHKLSHNTTWTAPFRKFTTHDGSQRRNQIRNQIDYIIVKSKYRSYIRNSRSYGGIITDTDHKLVLANFEIEVNLHKMNMKKELQINISELSKKENHVKYKENISHLQQPKDLTPQEKWAHIV